MAGGSNTTMTVKLWPNDLHDFLERRLKTHFEVRRYTLDPGKQSPPENGIAKPQSLSSEIDPLESNPLRKLIRIDEISAHRGLSSSSPNPSANETDRIRAQRRGWLSDQLRDYYEKHLDPTEFPDHSDLEALKAIEDAQAAFDCRLEAGFSQALDELKGLNYPGVTDPQIKIATRLRPTDGLTHNSAVQYSVLPENDSNPAPPLRLPEEYNGLGYQNLISMVFNLMSFRDAWMRVGKAGRTNIGMEAEYFIPPLHLVLVEEPEVHLHCQVQQVFVRQAYNVLRNHNDLKDIKDLRTQLLVSTHSSHVAHEVDFACLRYFRRLFAENSVEVPISSVVNLSEVFGKEDETKKFVTRYLRTTHADLFFADAAILVEGPAERLLVPHFIRAHYPTLDRCYISLLEIGGRHAHRLKPLIEHLGLTTLIITDLDSAESAGHHKKALPELGKNQVTTNPTLKTWFPKKSSIDELLDLPEVNKIYESPENKFSVRVAYQIPISYYDGNGSQSSSLANTLEIALILENLQLFSELTYDGPIKDIRDAIHRNKDQSSLLKALFKMLTKFDKAAFALDLLFLIEPAKLTIPGYIKYGLDWLHSRFADSPKIALNNESHLELNGDA